MAWLRRMVYKAGFRPKYGSIFFSPSTELILAVEDAMKSLKF